MRKQRYKNTLTTALNQTRQTSCSSQRTCGCCSSRGNANSHKIPSALSSAEGHSYTMKAAILAWQNSLQKSEHSPLSGKGLPTDVCCVSFFLQGIVGVLETTGGNSPLAEMRKTHGVNGAFFSVNAAVKGISFWRSPNIWWLQKKMGVPPHNSIHARLSQYCRCVCTMVHSVLKDTRRPLFSLSPSLPPTFPWPRLCNILHVSISLYLLLLALSGHCSSVNALSRRPTTAWAELLTRRYSCLGGHPQRPRCLIGFPMKGNSRFRPAGGNASHRRQQQPCGSLQIFETKKALSDLG